MAGEYTGGETVAHKPRRPLAYARNAKARARSAANKKQYKQGYPSQDDKNPALPTTKA